MIYAHLCLYSCSLGTGWPNGQLCVCSWNVWIVLRLRTIYIQQFCPAVIWMCQDHRLMIISGFTAWTNESLAKLCWTFLHIPVSTVHPGIPLRISCHDYQLLLIEVTGINFSEIWVECNNLHSWKWVWKYFVQNCIFCVLNYTWYLPQMAA